MLGVLTRVLRDCYIELSGSVQKVLEPMESTLECYIRLEAYGSPHLTKLVL